jgi:uncharacterized membrane protein YiaA
MEISIQKAFARHLIPGMLLYLLGIWWYGHLVHIFLIQKNENGNQMDDFYWRASSYYTYAESISKVLFGSVIAIYELAICRFSLNLDYEESLGGSLTNFDHLLICLAFVVCGCVELLEQKKVIPTLVNLPRLTCTVTFLLAAVNFYFHPSPVGLPQTLYQQISYLAVLTSLATVLEGVFPCAINLTLLRDFFCSLAGTWMMQVGYIICSESTADKYSDSERYQDFTWFLLSIHAMVVLLSYIGIYALADRCFYLGHHYAKVAFED